jgi:hypothetical protein
VLQVLEDNFRADLFNHLLPVHFALGVVSMSARGRPRSNEQQAVDICLCSVLLFHLQLAKVRVQCAGCESLV